VKDVNQYGTSQEKSLRRQIERGKVITCFLTGYGVKINSIKDQTNKKENLLSRVINKRDKGKGSTCFP